MPAAVTGYPGVSCAGRRLLPFPLILSRRLAHGRQPQRAVFVCSCRGGLASRLRRRWLDHPSDRIGRNSPIAGRARARSWQSAGPLELAQRDHAINRRGTESVQLGSLRDAVPLFELGHSAAVLSGQTKTAPTATPSCSRSDDCAGGQANSWRAVPIFGCVWTVTQVRTDVRVRQFVAYVREGVVLGPLRRVHRARCHGLSSKSGGCRLTRRGLFPLPDSQVAAPRPGQPCETVGRSSRRR